MSNPLPEIPDFQVFHVGAAPVIRQLIDRIGLIERIDEISPVKKETCKVSVGTRIAALIVNQLTNRKALYRVETFYKEQDIELLFGPEVEAGDFNDDALGRALDAIYRADLEKVYMQAVQGVQQAIDGLTWNHLHFDTTSLVYTGQPKEEADCLRIVQGYSKDHRPDLPQIKIGMGTTPQGIPVYGEVLNGNQDDKTWNTHFMEAITKWFNPEQLAQSIFVADSAFVTRENLQTVQGSKEDHQKEKKTRPPLSFVSRLPENFKLAQTLKEKAWDKNQWEIVGTVAEGKKAATYQIYPTQAKLYDETYRFLVVHSDKLDKRKQNSIQSKLEKENEQWKKDKEKLEKKDFSCEEDANKALGEWLKNHRGSHTATGTVIQEERPGKRKKRGRPKKGEAPPPPEKVWRIRMEVHPPSDEQYERMRQQASTFILITNEMETQNLSDIDLLKGYKEQQTVENRFRFLKNPYFVGRVFLEKPHRVKAFAYVMMLSVMVYALFEYLIRKNMEKEEEPLDQMGDNRKSFQPTGVSVLEILDTVQVVHADQDGETIRLLPKNQHPEVQRILRLLEMNSSVLHQPQREKVVERENQ